VEPPGGVAQHHIHVPGLGRLEGVKEHGAGVRSLVLADQLASGPFRPNLQLVGSGGPEGIRRAQQHPLALAFELMGHFSDRSRLTHAVDADEEHYTGRGGEVQGRVPYGDHLRQDLPEGRLYLLLVPELFLPDPLAQLLHCLQRSVHAQIRQDQRLLQFLEKGLVRLREAGEQIGGDFFQFVKKAHSTRPFALFCLIPGESCPAAAAVFSRVFPYPGPTVGAFDPGDVQDQPRCQQQSSQPLHEKYQDRPGRQYCYANPGLLLQRHDKSPF